MSELNGKGHVSLTAVIVIATTSRELPAQFIDGMDMTAFRLNHNAVLETSAEKPDMEQKKYYGTCAFSHTTVQVLNLDDVCESPYMSKFRLISRLDRDPETKNDQSGKSYTTFTVLANDSLGNNCHTNRPLYDLRSDRRTHLQTPSQELPPVPSKSVSNSITTKTSFG